jgi:predicted nucleic acid-binding Zn finger protein
MVRSRVANVSEANPVERWQAQLEETGELTPAVVEQISRLHDDRGVRAIEAVSENRVKRYRDFTIVVGYDDEYIVENGGCTCKDSEYNLDADDPTDLCWHVLAVAIARRVGHVDYHDMWYSEVRELL